MKINLKGLTCICRAFQKIHLVDRCLIVYMAVLLLQSAYSLIVHNDGIAQSNDIDVIVRTSAASIFGYFLSANFIHRDSVRPELTGESLEIGQEEELMEPEGDIYTVGGKFQIIIATAIGLFCLLTLILLRNWWCDDNTLLSTTAAAIVIQFRDFISGCVGFLIGCPTGTKIERS